MKIIMPYKKLIKPSFFVPYIFLSLSFFIVIKNYAMEIIEVPVKEQKNLKSIKNSTDLFVCMHEINTNFLELTKRTSPMNKESLIKLILDRLDNLIKAIKKFYPLEKFNTSKSENKDANFSVSSILSSEGDTSSSDLGNSETQKLIDQLTKYLKFIKTTLIDNNTIKIHNAMILFNSIFSTNPISSRDLDEHIKPLKKNIKNFLKQKNEMLVLSKNPPEDIKKYINTTQRALTIIKYTPNFLVNSSLSLALFFMNNEEKGAMQRILPKLKELFQQNDTLLNEVATALEVILQDNSIKKTLNTTADILYEEQMIQYIAAVQHSNFIEFFEKLRTNQENSLALLKKTTQNQIPTFVMPGSTTSYKEHRVRSVKKQLKTTLSNNELLNDIVLTLLSSTNNFDDFADVHTHLRFTYKDKAREIFNLIFFIQKITLDLSKKNNIDQENELNNLEEQLRKILQQNDISSNLKIELSKVNEQINNKDINEQESTLLSKLLSYLNPLNYFKQNKVGEDNQNDFEEDDIYGTPFSSDDETDDKNNSAIDKTKSFLKIFLSTMYASKEQLEKIIAINAKMENDLSTKFLEKIQEKIKILFERRRDEQNRLLNEKGKIPWLAFIQYIIKRNEFYCKSQIFAETSDLLVKNIDELSALIDKKFKALESLKQEAKNLYWFNIFKKEQYAYRIQAEDENLKIMINIFNEVKTDIYRNYDNKNIQTKQNSLKNIQKSINPDLHNLRIDTKKSYGQKTVEILDKVFNNKEINTRTRKDLNGNPLYAGYYPKDDSDKQYHATNDGNAFATYYQTKYFLGDKILENKPEILDQPSIIAQKDDMSEEEQFYTPRLFKLSQICGNIKIKNPEPGKNGLESKKIKEIFRISQLQDPQTQEPQLKYLFTPLERRMLTGQM